MMSSQPTKTSVGQELIMLPVCNTRYAETHPHRVQNKILNNNICGDTTKY